MLSLEIQLSEGEGCIPLTGLTRHIFDCPKLGPGIPKALYRDLFIFSVHWFEVRGSYSFC